MSNKKKNASNNSTIKSLNCLSRYDTTLCDKVCQWLAAGQLYSAGTSDSFTNKTDCHDITAILLKMALNTYAITHMYFGGVFNCSLVLLKIILLKTLTYTSIKELNPDRCTFSPKIQFHQSVFY
jgi:hypothetical protein